MIPGKLVVVVRKLMDDQERPTGLEMLVNPTQRLAVVVAAAPYSKHSAHVCSAICPVEAQLV